MVTIGLTSVLLAVPEIPFDEPHTVQVKTATDSHGDQGLGD